ncbi:hypothetical protein P7K49_033228 [Saguinus oedipus]|uniref:Brix domain-containing protein n=1 Tax=Saguinus oedipus TaxID=9490 RepID=A0ABQ9TRQ2_SAGOE|nr:hypothetical protein P7K49_033228 [Saguinus oedipus]
MGRSGRSRHQKRARAQAQLHNLEAYAANPHSFVFTRGCAGQNIRQLTLDVRRVMEPLTASRLQVRKKNSLKDCVAVAGPLGVTHFLILSKTETSVYFVSRHPHPFISPRPPLSPSLMMNTYASELL